MTKEVGVRPAATVTALKPATWKLATESVLSMSRSFVSTLPLKPATESSIRTALSTFKTEALSTGSKVTDFVKAAAEVEVPSLTLNLKERAPL